jgi:hypothetical protein
MQVALAALCRGPGDSGMPAPDCRAGRRPRVLRMTCQRVEVRYRSIDSTRPLLMASRMGCANPPQLASA